MYKDTLQTQVLESAAASVKFGANLTDRKLTDFQEEQMGQLYELMLESTKPNRQFDIQGDGKWNRIGILLVFGRPTESFTSLI